MPIQIVDQNNPNIIYEVRTPDEEVAAVAAQAIAIQQIQDAQALQTLIQQNMQALSITDLVNQGLITTDQQATLLAPLTQLNNAKINVSNNQVVTP